MAYNDTRPFPDAEGVMLALLAPVASTVVVSPVAMDEPLIQVRRTGGSDDGVTDHARIEVECVAFDRHNAWRLAECVRQRVLAAGATVQDGALIDRTTVETAPQQVPEDNPDIRRVVATYRLAMRRPL